MQMTTSQSLIIGREIPKLSLPHLIITVILGMALLCAGAIVSGRQRLAMAQASYEHTKRTLEAQLAAKQSLENDLHRLQTDPKAVSQLARERLNYLAKNEIAIIIKETK